MPLPSSSQVTLSSNPRKRRARLFFRGLLLGILLGALAGFLYIRNGLAPVSDASTPTEFEVLPGWGGKRVALELERAGLVRDARVFDYFLRYRGLDRSIGEGVYDLDPSLSAAGVAAVLAQGGRPRTAFVVLPEGFRLVDIARELAAAGFSTEAAWLELMTNPGELRPEYVPADAGLEGYLFPAGYEIPLKSAPEAVLGQMLDRFEEEHTPQVQASLDDLGLSVHDWVTLASMVQAEAANTEEMPIIVGVFLNRLDRGMLLQSDPTVAYGLGKPMPELSAVAGDLQVDTPWNTYTRPGLPVGPINSPGREALQAIFSPTRQSADGDDYLYFLHGADAGEAVFRPNTTLEAHNRDVQRYLR